MKYKVTLNNRVYEVEVEEGEAMLVDEYELAAPAAPAPAYTAPAAAPVAAAPATVSAAPAGEALAAGTRVDAPLPGNVLMVKVAVGQAVKAGDVLVIIEAMKMENEVAAPCDGTVKQVVAQKGAVVETGAPLVVLG